MNICQQPLTQAIGLLILRLGMGGFMLTHGLGKVQMLIAGQFEMIGDPVGIGPVATLVLLTLAEFVAALLVLVGLFTRLAAIPLIIAMAVAGLVAHANDPWTMDQAAQLFFAGQTEYPASRQPALMYLTAFLALAFTGPGCFSIDTLIRRRRQTRRSEATPTTPHQS